MDVPTAGPALSRVGLERVHAVVLLATDGRPPRPLPARLQCFVEPDPARAAARPARFEEIVGDALRDAVTGRGATRPDRLAVQIAERARERHGARRAEVTVAARVPVQRSAPVSGIPTQQIFTLLGRAAASEHGTRRMVGVAAQGMTTSPHGQTAVAAGAGERLAARGFSAAQIAQALDAVPVATHDQIGVGTLHLGCAAHSALDVDADDLLSIVHGSMSSEIFELLKRPDEAAVVERAHRRPRTAQDCVGAMIAGVLERFAEAADDVLVAAAQRTTETIHGHHVSAERDGLLGDLRRELRTGEAVAPGMSLRAWLDG